MKQYKIIEELARNREVFKSLLMQVAKDEYLYKPAPDKWNLLEIVCHLYDEEREDFRFRTKQTLFHPEQPWPPILPAEWVTERAYHSKDYNETLQKFLYEREESIEWLQSLSYPKWENAYNHPKVGLLSASMLLANWLAHDYLHIRQIIRLKYQYLGAVSGEDMKYAGEW